MKEKNVKKRLFALAALLLSAVLVFAGCSSGGSNSTDPLADGKLDVAMDDTYVPMEYRDNNNNLVGFDVDLSEALAKQMGVKAEIHCVAWDGIFTGLTSNQYDVIISTTSITPERKENYQVSDPYMSNGIVIVGRKDYGDSAAKTFQELEGKTVGVQIETSADHAIQKLKEDTGVNVNVKQFDGMLDAFSALEGKQVDYVMTDENVGSYYVSQKPDTFVVTSTAPLTNEPIGIIARKESEDLMKKIDEALKVLRDNGTLKELSNKWFGKDLTSNIDTTLNVIE